MPYDGQNIKDLDTSKPTEGASYIPELNDSDREIKRVLKNQFAVSEKTDNYTLTASDSVIIMKSSGKTITLPSPSSVAGSGYTKLYYIKNDSTGDIYISGTIDGESGKTLQTLESVLLFTDGSDWYINKSYFVADHGSTHIKNGSDEIKIDDLADPDDNTDLDVSTTAHGLCPKLPNDTTKFLRGDGSWAVPASASGSAGCALSIGHAYFNPVDNKTYYFGNQAWIAAPSETSWFYIRIPKSGTIKYLQLWNSVDVPGTDEEVVIKIRKNGGTPVTVGTVTFDTNLVETYLDLNISVEKDDWIEIVYVMPTFITNPESVRGIGFIYLE